MPQGKRIVLASRPVGEPKPPWMRGAPQRGFSMLICRINARSPASICGRPPKDRDFQCQ